MACEGIWLIAYTILLVKNAIALNCYICGDNNLDEFGECSTQFQYDCSSYARRFQPSESIFCRTTRQRAANNTYTIMKECISERDHYRMFPRKSYPLDEECDLIEIESVETAYCLCRHSDFCNEKSISDQFIAFEEQHPELFGDIEEDNTPEAQSSNSQSESQLINAETRGPEQEIEETINDGRRRHMAAPTADSMDGHRIDDSQTVNGIATSKVTPHTIVQGTKSIEDVREAAAGELITRMDGLDSSNIDRHMSQQWNSFGTSTKSSKKEASLMCMQCGQANLQGAEADCEKQIVVECNRRGSPLSNGEQYFCFARQILIGPGKNAVEKMCVTHRALIEEYGDDVVLDGCTSTNTGRVRFCVCQTNECNRMPIYQKMPIDQKFDVPLATTAFSVPAPPSRRQPMTSCFVCNENNLNNADADCSKPVALDCNQQFKDGSGSLCLTRRTQLAPAMYSVEKRCLSRNELIQNAARTVVEIGCGDAYDGLVVYCICDGQLCNRETVTVQLQKDTKYISSRKETDATVRTSSPRKLDASAIEPIIHPSSARRGVTASTSAETTTPSGQLQRPIVAAVIVTAAPKRKAEERFAAERQQRWRDADDDNFNTASTCNLTTALIAFLASTFLLALC